MSINGPDFNFAPSVNSNVNKEVIFVNKNAVKNNVKKVVEYQKNGFSSSNSHNQSIFINLDKNESMSVLFSNFRSDISSEPYLFNDYVPIFLEQFNQNKNLQQVVNGDLYINGIVCESMTLVYGNKYKLHVPNYFGNIYIDKNNSYHSIQLLNSNNLYSEYEIISNLDGGPYFSIKFSNVPLVNIKCNILYNNNIRALDSGSKHPLSFYQYQLNGNRWLFYSPYELVLEKWRKTDYNYFATNGDGYSFFVNGYENPLIIFDYDIVYRVENKNKMDHPFYFDYGADGMFKKPYEDFENDLNTDRSYLKILFPSDERRNSINIDPFILTRGNVGEMGVLDYWEDPYEEFPAFKERYPIFDPDNIFYCSAKNSYFGNRVLVGKRFINEIIGKYGLSSPRNKSIQYSEEGSYFVYDIFNHMSGRFFNVNCKDLNYLLFNNESSVSEKILNGDTKKYISKNNAYSYIQLIPDVFNNYESLAQAIRFDNKIKINKVDGSLVFLVPFDILNLKSELGSNLYNYYLSINKEKDSTENYSVFVSKFNNLMQRLVLNIKSISIFEVGVQYV